MLVLKWKSLSKSQDDGCVTHDPKHQWLQTAAAVFTPDSGVGTPSAGLANGHWDGFILLAGRVWAHKEAGPARLLSFFLHVVCPGWLDIFV